ncbi:UNKNOWN [Stylonychia lemnae]|uniref:Enkurin domain-containing protein n=1 Tax=Stylonychia lemnae TaxID=5949 RepID=A0A077ZNI1_STYLE|nr:UNKNOWN [Stylonychia lemnae]|eukprot:CDW71532.1 UNKNOWN [Stylonychia lemnae]
MQQFKSANAFPQSTGNPLTVENSIQNPQIIGGQIYGDIDAYDSRFSNIGLNNDLNSSQMGDSQNRRRKRSERVKQREQTPNKLFDNAYNAYGQTNHDCRFDTRESAIQKETEISNVYTIDQFANFLLSKQSSNYQYFQNDEQVADINLLAQQQQQLQQQIQAQQQQQQQQQDFYQSFLPVKQNSQQNQQQNQKALVDYDDHYSQNVSDSNSNNNMFSQLANNYMEGNPQRQFHNVFNQNNLQHQGSNLDQANQDDMNQNYDDQQQNDDFQRFKNSSLNHQNVLATDHSINQNALLYNDHPQSKADSRAMQGNLNLDLNKMSLKESPIKGMQNHDIDLSYYNKDDPLSATPSAIMKKCNFSPETPISQLNNLVTMNNNTPLNQKFNNQNQFIDDDSNFGEDYGDDKSQFKETIKSQSTDIRSAIADLENMNKRNINGRYTELSRPSSNNKYNQPQSKPHSTERRIERSHSNINTYREHQNQPFNPQQLHIDTKNLNKPLDQQDIDKAFLIMQYDLILQQLNDQIQKLLIRNQELEQSNLQSELIVQQQNGIISEMQSQVQAEKLASQQSVEQLQQIIGQREIIETELEKHKQILQLYSNELDLSRQQTFDLDQRLQIASQQSVAALRQEQDAKAKIDDLIGRVRHLETQLRIKEDEIFKLRQDNQNMFSDLRNITQTEEQYKVDILEGRGKRQELEIQNEDLRERTSIQEQKIKSLQAELEKVKRETNHKLEQSKMNELNMEEMRDENKQLRDRLTQIEQERINLVSDRERKDRDNKNLQAELNRMSQMVQTYKNMAQQNELRMNQSAQEVKGYFGASSNKSDYDNDNSSRSNVSWLNSSNNNPGNNRQVLKNTDMNSYHKGQNSFTDQSNTISWVHGQSNNQTSQQPNEGVFGDYSPLKKSDPNVPYAQRQKMMQKNTNSPSLNQLYGDKKPAYNQHQQPSQIAWGGNSVNVQQQFNNTPMDSNPQSQLQQLKKEKQRLEGEYSKIPITINGKSLQIKKRKEELEFELDAVEKQISRCTLKLKEHNGY